MAYREFNGNFRRSKQRCSECQTKQPRRRSLEREQERGIRVQHHLVRHFYLQPAGCIRLARGIHSLHPTLIRFALYVFLPVSQLSNIFNIILLQHPHLPCFGYKFSHPLHETIRFSHHFQHFFTPFARTYFIFLIRVIAMAFSKDSIFLCCVHQNIQCIILASSMMHCRHFSSNWVPWCRVRRVRCRASWSILVSRMQAASVDKRCAVC